MNHAKKLGIAAALLLLPTAAGAAGMPAIRTSADNQVPACVTPGRLTAYLKSRNRALDPRFEKIAVEYMRRGEELGLRWDYTFYQMVLETGYLSYRGDRGRRGDVHPKQNNFAGIGATGNGNPGESFPDVPTGVLAHLQHVLLYAGETIDNPVAERTRKVQEWGILKSLKRKARGEITFAHLATKWAPGSRYVAGLSALADKFHDEFCNAPDPNPEWVAEARGIKVDNKVAGAAEPAATETTGEQLARRAIEEGKAAGDNRMAGLGAAAIANASTPSYSILNAPSNAQPAAASAAVGPAAGATRPLASAGLPGFVNASAAGALGGAANPGAAAAAPKKCRVWTASYGGQKALIIRVNSGKGTDYTVLDVNEGAESREAQAYIAAYAKGGVIAGEYPSQSQALEKAFELCPEN